MILYVRDMFVSYANDVLIESKSDSVWCQIKLGGSSEITLGVCYKSQVADITELQNLISAITTASKKDVLIMGNFNFPHVNWDSCETDKASREFRDLVFG